MNSHKDELSQGGSPEDERTENSNDTEQTAAGDHPPPGSPILEAILENARNQQYLGQRLDATDERVETDRLGDIVRHGPVLETLRNEPLDRREIEDRLDVSRATSHRLTQWLDERGFVEKTEGRFQLTGHGEAIADEVLRFEANVRTVHRLAPLLDVICEDHQEFIVEPFVGATVTTAEPDDPYRPIERFVALLGESETFRGFNTTHMAPLVLGEFHERMFDTTDTEIIYLPHIVEKLFETYPTQASEAIDQGHLTLRTREDLPYGLAIFDTRVGIGGYDEGTGQMQVFADTDSPIAREWAERVYSAVRADSKPLEETSSTP